MVTAQESPPQRNSKSGTLRRFLLLIRSNWISTLGAAVAFLALMGLFTTLFMQFSGVWTGPYVGILTIGAIPAVLMGGLLLVPLGLLVYRRDLRQRVSDIADRPMHLARAVVLLTMVNFAGIGAAGATGVKYMSSNQFCGMACHSAMEPEFVAFQNSPHRRIECVDCHIGPGAGAALKAKLNGVNQLIGIVTDNWERPIPTPVHQLRPASEICTTCHWEDKDLGTKLVVRTRFRENETNRAFTNVLLMRTGGLGPDGIPQGIHWHTHPENVVEYVATDEKRMEIPWVQVTRPDGSVDVYTTADTPEDPPPQGERRSMDCNDCHNRVGHPFTNAVDAVDEALAFAKVSRRIPGIRKTAVELLRKEWSRTNVDQALRRELVAAYGADGQLDAEMEPLVEATVEHLAEVWRRNVYPERGVTWGTYPSLKTHEGCFRCHNGDHSTSSGKVITNQCNVCHVVLSNEQSEPDVLETLGLRRQR